MESLWRVHSVHYKNLHEDVAEFVQTSLQQKNSICSGNYIHICLHSIKIASVLVFLFRIKFHLT